MNDIILVGAINHESTICFVFYMFLCIIVTLVLALSWSLSWRWHIDDYCCNWIHWFRSLYFRIFFFFVSRWTLLFVHFSNYMMFVSLIFEGWDSSQYWGQDRCMDFSSTRYNHYPLAADFLLFNNVCWRNFVSTVSNLVFLIRKWGSHANTALWAWSKVWATFWFFSRQNESTARWSSNCYSVNVFVSCWEGWWNCLSQLRSM